MLGKELSAGSLFRLWVVVWELYYANHFSWTSCSALAGNQAPDTKYLTMAMIMKKSTTFRRKLNTTLNSYVNKMNENETMAWNRDGFRLVTKLLELDEFSPPELLGKVCDETLNSRANLIFYVELGNDKTSSMDYLLQVTNFLGLPVMVWIGDNSGIVQPNPESMILQVMPSIQHQCKAILSLLRRYNWHAFAVVTGSMAGQDYFVNVLRGLAEQSRDWNLEILAVVKIPVANDRDHVISQLTKLQKSEARIILLYAGHKESEKILSRAAEMKLTGREFIWIVTKSVHGQDQNVSPSFFSGMLGIDFKTDPETDLVIAIKAVVNLWAHAMDSMIRNSVNDDMGLKNLTLIPEDIQCSASVQRKWRHGHHLYSYIKSSSTEVSGKNIFKFAFNGDGTLKDTTVTIINLHANKWKPIGSWSENEGLRMDDITWPGMEPSPPKGHPAKYHVRVVTLQEKPYVVYSDIDYHSGSCPPQSVPCKTVGHLSNKMLLTMGENVTVNRSMMVNQCCSGLCIDLLKILSEKIGLEFDLFEVPDKVWGAYDKKKNEWNGLIKTILDGEADMVVTSLKITPERSKFIDFTVPFLETGITILVAVRDGVISPTAFLEPYDYPSWCLILVFSVHACGAALFLFEWLSPHSLDRGNKSIHEHKFSLFRAFWLMWSMLFGAAVNVDNPRGPSGRFLANIWALFAVVFTASYTANLAAFMITKEDYDHLIGIQDPRLLNPHSHKPPFKYATVSYGSTESTLKRNYPTIYGYMKEHNKTDAPEGVKAVKDGEINAFIYDATVLEYLASHDDGCKLRTVGNWYAMTGYGIGFPKGSKWGAIMNKILVQLQYDGEMERLQKFWLAGECKKNDAKGESSLPLGILNFTSAFILLACGMLLVGFLLLLEHVYFKFFLTRLRKWDQRGCCSLISLSIGRSLTFEQSVREAMDLQKNYKCKNPCCEIQMWKLKHELDLAKLSVARLQDTFRKSSLNKQNKNHPIVRTTENDSNDTIDEMSAEVRRKRYGGIQEGWKQSRKKEGTFDERNVKKVETEETRVLDKNTNIGKIEVEEGSRDPGMYERIEAQPFNSPQKRGWQCSKNREKSQGSPLIVSIGKTPSDLALDLRQLPCCVSINRRKSETSSHFSWQLKRSKSLSPSSLTKKPHHKSMHPANATTVVMSDSRQPNCHSIDIMPVYEGCSRMGVPPAISRRNYGKCFIRDTFYCRQQTVEMETTL